MKIYIATSWKNPAYEKVRDALKAVGHDVYDFKDPKNAFNWREILPEADLRRVTPAQGMIALNHSLAQGGFEADFKHLQEADLLILCLPAGNSSHLEAGFVRGRGKPVWVFVDEPVQELAPELMWKMLGYPSTCIRTVGDLVSNSMFYATRLAPKSKCRLHVKCEGTSPGCLL